MTAIFDMEDFYGRQVAATFDMLLIRKQMASTFNMEDFYGRQVASTCGDE